MADRKALPVSEQRMVTMSDIAYRLGLTLMTLHAWRKGSRFRRPLPVRAEDWGCARRIFVSEHELILWLTNYRPDLRNRWISTADRLAA